MEPGSLPIGRLAPRSWSNLLWGGPARYPEDTCLHSNRQLRRAARMLQNGGVMADLTREVEDLRARTLVGSRAGRPKAAQVMNLHRDEGPRNRRHCSAAPIRRVPRQRGRARPHWVAASVRLSDQARERANISRARHHPRSPRTSAAADRRLHRGAAGLERGHVRCFTAHRCTKHGRVSCECVGGGREWNSWHQKDEWKTVGEKSVRQSGEMTRLRMTTRSTGHPASE